MAAKTVLDLITRPLARKIALHAVTAIVSAVGTILVERGWLDPATAGSLSDALATILTNVVDVVFQ